MYNNGNSSYIKRLLVVIIMISLVVVGGSFAWFTYQSKEAALVLTIGDINDTQIILTPYQINGVMAPGTTYESGVYSEVTVNKGTTNSTSFALFYKINELDSALIDNGLSYTVTNSQTGDVVKTGKFSDIVDTSKPLPDEVVIFNTNTLTENSSVNYKVYLWLDSSVGSQNNLSNTKLDVELNGSIGSVIIEGESAYGHLLSASITDAVVDSNITYTYQWYFNTSKSTSGGTAISGATDSTYLVGTGLSGKYIYVVVTSSSGKTLSDITDENNDYNNACDNFNDGRVERETPLITLSATSGTVQVGADNSFNVMIDKSEEFELTYGNVESASGTLTAVSALTSNVTIKAGASTLVTISEGTFTAGITYHGEASIAAQSNIIVTYTPSNTADVCTVSKEYTVTKEDNVKPELPVITLTDCDTFTYLSTDNVGVTGYYISAVNNIPSLDAESCTDSSSLNCWITNSGTKAKTLNFTVGDTAMTYYVWARDAYGNISESSSTELAKITRIQGEGTTLTTRYNSTSSSSGTVFTNSPYVLRKCSIYTSAVATSGYNNIVLTHNGTSVTTSGTKATVTDNFSVASSATSNKVTITLNENGSAATNTGYSVSLSTSSSSDTATFSGTTNGSTISFESGTNALVSGTTYYIWSGKSSNDKTTRIYSGVSVKGAANTTQAAAINYYGLTLLEDIGLTVSNGGVSTTNEVQYLYHATAGSRQTIAINATVEYGYTWNTWTQTSGTALTTFTAATQSQNVKMGAGAATLTALANPNAYTINFDANGGTGAPSAQTKYYGITLTLSDIKPTRTDYTFLGWSTDSSATSATWGAGGSYSVNPESDVTLYAVWKTDKILVSFDLNGGIGTEVLKTTEFTAVGQKTYTVPSDGTYKLEVWGAQGGGNGGYGSYSSGNLSLNAGTVLYVNIGGQGKLNKGGSNGGGDGQVIAGTISPAGYGGGGATHIASASGMLKNVNSSKIYIVAGGGGGGSEAEVQGAHAGGYKGNDSTGGCFVATGGTQSSGGSPGDEDATAGGYGYGGSAPYGDESNAYGAGGGGGGYYGGGGNSYYYNNPDCSSAGAGGSGYIGNSLLTDKAMYCYNCSTSNNINTKTYSITNVSTTATANYAKKGNGAAKISLLGISNKTVTNGSAYGELPTPTKNGYTFVGWNTKADGSGTTITSNTIVSLESDIILYAVWASGNVTITFDANGGELAQIYDIPGEHTYTVPKTGTYKLEVWGAQGGKYDATYYGGYGGYSVGTVDLTAGTNLYVNVGGKGIDGCKYQYCDGGYNGGGRGAGDSSLSVYSSGGGGASHIATTSGELKNLSSNTNSILIVAGGGGGTSYESGPYAGIGGSGGGYIGSNGTNTQSSWLYGSGGTQSSGGGSGGGNLVNNTVRGVAGIFGKGGDGNYYSGGGGGGYYGGGASNQAGAGGGSGYIGNSSLTNKAMYCYNCSTSNDVSTKTISTTDVSDTPTANYAKMGDGAVRITWLGTNDKVVTGGSTYGELPTPSRYKYEFVGWNTKADGTGETITSETIVNFTEDITLYAIWKKASVYLYNNGIWNTGLTGNLGTAGRMLEEGAGREKAPRVSKGTKSFTVTQIADGDYTATGGWAYFETVIDLTDYNTIIFEGSFSSGNNAYRGVGVWSNTYRGFNGYVWSDMQKSIIDLTNGVGTADISDLEGEYYIGFWGYNSGSYVTCKSLRLE